MAGGRALSMASSLMEREGMGIVEAYILARKIQKAERKVENDMNEIKEFIQKHKTEILIGTGIIFVYKVGFNMGCKASDRAVNNLVKEAARSMTRF